MVAEAAWAAREGRRRGVAVVMAKFAMGGGGRGGGKRDGDIFLRQVFAFAVYPIREGRGGKERVADSPGGIRICCMHLLHFKWAGKWQTNYASTAAAEPCSIHVEYIKITNGTTTALRDTADSQLEIKQTAV